MTVCATSRGKEKGVDFMRWRVGLGLSGNREEFWERRRGSRGGTVRSYWWILGGDVRKPVLT